MGHWPNEQLIEIIDDEAQDWRWRHAAIMNLAGTKRYGGPGLSESNDRPATYLFQQMVKNGMSLAGYYVAAKTCSRLQDSMWPSLYIMDEWARHAGSVEVIPTPVPSEQVGKLLGAAYDRHVREGKVAIAKAFRESPKLQQFLIASPETRGSRCGSAGCSWPRAARSTGGWRMAARNGSGRGCGPARNGITGCRQGSKGRMWTRSARSCRS